MKSYVWYRKTLLLFFCGGLAIASNLDATYMHDELDTFDTTLLTAESNFLLPISGQDYLLEGGTEHEKDLSIITTRSHRQPKKKWTIIVYIAGDNDLRGFVARNIRQMAHIGSNDQVNIVAHLDVSFGGNNKVTRRYYIEKNQIIHVNQNDAESQCMDSGDPETLISCCKWAIESYPADYYALVFWNHGTGIIDPQRGRIITPSALFNLNPQTRLLELDRSIGFMELMSCLRECEEASDDPRGICWDDTTGHYISNQKLTYALDEIQNSVLKGKKFSIIAFDACLMSMIEIAHMIKKYADIMVSSQEVELGTGWDYQLALQPLATSVPSPMQLAKHIVEAYRRAYNAITHDYTQSAIDLSVVQKLEDSVHAISALLLECLRQQRNNSVKNAIRASRNRTHLTHFDEPSYVDLDHLLDNLATQSDHFDVENRGVVTQLKTEIHTARALIKKAVIANTAGKNLERATGLSIYFPERGMDQSYPKCPFSSENKWNLFLTHYLYR